ncbi:hypothetical protein SAMN06265795_1322 [Noviherbaspirillum humi]|uniref:Uncharacterized protein n=1 Tax=Noviherbaspirillum humi TaxID=1688639 RepID=A0A239M6F4_9BURK|nr:hypothetical protein [Noviherbaspirillum humi]SNT37693.1 hypothetical protein SAMN06265795_1322 [Noviherbaspirillum humi]
MNRSQSTQILATLIEDYIDATLGAEAGAREKHVKREALRSIIRVAEMEQTLAMNGAAEQYEAVEEAVEPLALAA